MTDSKPVKYKTQCEFLHMGGSTYKIPLKMYSKNRVRLVERLRKLVPAKCYVLLQGGDEVKLYDTDVPMAVFRQEAFFNWAFGVAEPGCYGAIDIDRATAILFIPRLDLSYAVWLGPLLNTEDYHNKYALDEVYYVDEMPDVLKRKVPACLYTLRGRNDQSNQMSLEANFKGIDKFRVDGKLLYEEMAALRMIKTEMEIGVMTYTAEVSSAAHRKVMRMAKPGIFEYQCESEFLHHTYSQGGCRFIAYTSICGSGANGAILHYGHAAAPNDKQLNAGDMLMFDMGASYFGYCADISLSFPCSGRFSADQRQIYNTVFNAFNTVFAALKPGVSWVDMHALALQSILSGLESVGILKGDVGEMMKAELGPMFMPHGIGRSIGLDAHDVGGYLTKDPSRPFERGFDTLRTARKLEKGMVMTVEPGCYFIEPLIEEALANSAMSKFIVANVLQRFRNTGGIRIEDNVYIKDEGAVSMTKVPRRIEDIERWIAGHDDDKYR